MSKKNFPSRESLKIVETILSETEKSLGDMTRTNKSVVGDMQTLLEKITDSNIFNAVGTTAGAVVGGAASVGLLSVLGTTGLSAAGITSGLAAAGSILGGGMVAGIGVIAAPAVAIAGGTYAITKGIQNRNLKTTKIQFLDRCEKTRDNVQNHIIQESNASPDRVKHLQALKFTLDATINDLRSDII